MNEWLNCSIYPGQFSDEYAVQGKLFDGRDFSLFATRGDLEFEGDPTWDQPVQGLIRIRTLDQKDDLLLVALPQTTLENGRTITVKSEQVKSLCL